MENDRLPITFSMSRQLLNRVDAIAEARGDSRSITIERLLIRELDGEEEYLQTLEIPIVRALHKLVTNSPAVLANIASMVGEQLTEEELRELIEKAPVQRKKGKERQQEKKMQAKGSRRANVKGGI